MEFFAPNDIFHVAFVISVVMLLIAIAIARLLWRRLVPPKPVRLIREDYMRFEQRRWSNPGSTRRLLVFLGISVVSIGGTIAIPWWLGVAQSPGWYLKEWWIALFFGAVAVSIVSGFWITRRAVHRCPTCLTARLDKTLGKRMWIYVCPACEIVWQTGIPTRSRH